jgi:hypothetical protein
MIRNATKLKRSENLKDRLITTDEINKITKQCHSSREKAFFTIMRQSGLPPHTIKQLKIEHVERILEPNTPVPCKITIPHQQTPTFIGHEAVSHLKQYLENRSDRPNLTQESLLFTIHNKPNKKINTKDVSRAFKIAAQKLQRHQKITYEIKKGKPSELRLYNLIRFYKENAKKYLTELNNTNPKNDESYRNLYEKEAMPNLEIELPTPIQIHQLKDRLAKIEKTVQETVMPIERIYYEVAGLIPEDKNVLFELKPHIPEKNEKDREQRLQNALHELVKSMKEEDKKALASMTTNNNDVPRNSANSGNRYAKPTKTKHRVEDDDKNANQSRQTQRKTTGTQNNNKNNNNKNKLKK